MSLESLLQTIANRPIYAHTVNRFEKLDSVNGLTEDLVKDPTIEAAFNWVPSEIIASLSLILAPIMLVAHTYNHIDSSVKTDALASEETIKTDASLNSENNNKVQSF